MTKCLSLLLFLLPFSLSAQDSLLYLLNQENEIERIYTEATFKGTRLINGHSVETRKKGVLDVIISHRFGRINSGAYELFGLDDAQIRIGVDFGFSDRLNAGFGRSSFEKTYDGFLKYKVLQQQTGKAIIPVSVVAFSSVAIKSLDTEINDTFTSRLTYNFQLLIARKFSPGFSFQLTPTMIHKNQIIGETEDHDVFALGAGGRIKLTKRLSLNAEYFYRFNQPSPNPFQDAIAIGFDIETGGHVFQLHFTNARAMIEKGFINETRDDFFDGDIHFGFNISRTFQLY